MFSPQVAIRIIYFLGFLNVITGLLIFFSCRCLPGSRIGKNWMHHKFYQRFFKTHCYIWWVFWISVMIHATMVFIYIGPPVF